MQLDLPAPAAQPKQQLQQGRELQRHPSTGELLLGAAQPPPQLPEVAPLQMPQPVEPPSPGGLASPSTPQAAESARRAAAACAAASLQRLQQQYQEQLSLQQQAASAAAAAASAALASGQDPSQSYTAQYSAAAAHAAQALALQRQLQLQQALLSSCGYPVANTTGPSGGGPRGSFSCDLLSSYGASQAAAIAAIYGQQAQHSRQAMSGPAEPAGPDASAGATPVPTSPGAPGPGSPWAGGSVLGAGWTGGLSPATQPATPPVQRRSVGPPTLQVRFGVAVQPAQSTHQNTARLHGASLAAVRALTWPGYLLCSHGRSAPQLRSAALPWPSTDASALMLCAHVLINRCNIHPLCLPCRTRLRSGSDRMRSWPPSPQAVPAPTWRLPRWHSTACLGHSPQADTQVRSQQAGSVFCCATCHP